MVGGARGLVFKALTLAMVILGLSSSSAWAGGWLDTGEVPFDVKDVVVDSDGNTIAVGINDFEDTDDVIVQVSTRTPDGDWTAPNNVSHEVHNLASVKIATNGKGHVVVVWRVVKENKDQDIQAAARTPSGEWTSGPEEVDASMPHRDVEVVVDAQGTATVNYVNVSGNLVSRTRTAGGVWSGATELRVPPNEGQIEVHTLTINEAGDLFAAWEEAEEISGTALKVVERHHDQGWGSPVTIVSGSPDLKGALQLEADEQGGLAAVWALAATDQVLATIKPPNGSWPPQPTVVGLGAWPSADFDSQGTLTVVWQSEDGSGISVRSKPRNGGWGSTEELVSADADNGEEALRPKLGINQDDLAVAFWLHRTPGETEFEAARMEPGSNWKPAGELAIDTDPDEGTVVAALDPWGSMALVWENYDTPDTSRWGGSAVLDWAPPQLRGLGMTGMPNRLVRFTVQPSDPRGPVVTRWTFPGGRVVEGTVAEHTFSGPGTFRVMVTATDTLGNVAEANRNVKIEAPAPSSSSKCKQAQKRTKALRTKVRRTAAKIKRLNRQIKRAKSPAKKRKLRATRAGARRTLKKQKRNLKLSYANEKGFCRIGK